MLLVINLMILIKLGIVPFHFWFIDLIINLNWLRCLILSTWQKIIPFIIMIYINKNIYINVILILIRGVIRVIFGGNQINLKKIIGYSSITHICWLLFSLVIRELLWFIYFISYFILNLILMKLFDLLNLKYFLDLFKYKNDNLKIIFILIILSLGGLPPFFGFILKWYRIFKLRAINAFINLNLIFYSLIYLYNYIRLTYNAMLINYLILKIKFINNLKNININLLIILILFCVINLFLINFWILY